MSIKRFNLGFGFFGPREYCETGKFVDADEVKAIIDNECEYYIDKAKKLKKSNSDLINEYCDVESKLTTAYENQKKLMWVCFGLFITNVITLALLLWTKYGN